MFKKGLKSKVFGFTLAEVLIALGVIGVVVALTIPSLIQKTQDAEFHSAWKKEFSVISQAYDSVRADNNYDMSTYFTASGIDGLFTDMGKYISYRNADLSSVNFSTVYKTLSGAYLSSLNLTYMQYDFKDGTHLSGRYDTVYTPSNSMIVWVDVNGVFKGPNVLGKDLYGLLIYTDRILPMGATGTNLENTCNKTAYSCPKPPFEVQDCAGASCSYEYLQK